MTEAEQLIKKLNLAPHPEGGWFRETWRAPSPSLGGRDGATAILFLLEQGQRSHWHRVDAAEIWFFHAGSAITLGTARDNHSQPSAITLGGDVLAGEHPQHLVRPGEWQSAEAGQGWALMACVVVPGFSFDGFELAPADWVPGAFRAG